MALKKTTGGKPSLKRLLKERAAKKAVSEQKVDNNRPEEKLTFTKVWGKMLIELRAGRYRALYGEASIVETGEVDGDTISVVAPKYSVEVLNDPENKATLERTMFMLFNKHFKLIVNEKPELKDPNIDKLKKLFGSKLKIEE